MKRKYSFLGACFMVLVLASSAFAGGVVNKTNWSAEYIRTMNRNAATDFADIVFYNPAGTVLMDSGGYLNVSAHYFPKLYEHTISGPFGAGTYESDEPSIVPGLFALYNAGRYSLFFGVSNMVGGGKVEYDDGSLRTVLIGGQLLSNPQIAPAGYSITNQQISAEQMGPGYMIGGAFKATDQLSFSMGVRFIDAQKEAKGTVTIANVGGPSIPGVNDPVTSTIDYEWDAQGFGAIFGVNYALSRETNIAARYETPTVLRYDYTIKQGEQILAALGIEDGMSKREDHPATLALGVSHQFLPKLRAESNLTYYFNKDADWGDDQKKFNNGYDIGIALEYAVTPQLLGSIGYMYTRNGLKSSSAGDISVNLPENPHLDSHSIGLGGAYAVTPNLVFNTGLGGVFYNSENVTVENIGPVKYEKTIYFMALGVQYKFM